MTNDEINAENERIREQARRDKADKRVIPQSGYDGRTVQHALYTKTYNEA